MHDFLSALTKTLFVILNKVDPWSKIGNWAVYCKLSRDKFRNRIEIISFSKPTK